MGVLNSSERFPPSAAFVLAMRLISPVHIFPEGITNEALLTAEIASCGEIRYCLSLPGSSVMTIVLWFPPNGGGAETPGSVANKGRTRLSAKSCNSPCVCVALLKTSCPTATLPRVESRDEGRHRSRRHECPGAVYIADGLRHRLAMSVPS
jgi:hypothetical protein